ncbi:MAG: Nucleoside triphosphate pyrophosphohydrolase [Marinobacterium sp. xm-d-530]|jgi:ATP diphosphatase|nr:MAG: Nucleoside triphosphate pyrophosphohydrolase [Marinobacterium sp. xm-d-530]
MNDRYTVDDLIYLMQRLRDPDTGCPWDLEQTFASIVPHTLEEAYEVADTIERQDWAHLKDELGDLLFQVIFYSQLGKEQSLFDLNAVVDHLCGKLVRRHPHVFPTGQLRDSAELIEIDQQAVNAQWERIKEQERESKDRTRVLDEVPTTLPAMSRAVKLTKRASKVGFDWDDATGVLDKIEEEIQELREAMQQGDFDAVREELGDLLFVNANLARKLSVDPEQAVRNTNLKFERRFNHVEDRVLASGKDWSEFSLEELDAWWDEAKQIEKSKK